MKQTAYSFNPSWKLSLAVFVAIFTLVHLFYEGVIRPTAAAAVAQHGIEAAKNIWVIIADFEQQLCFTLGLYALFIILYKIGRIQKEEGLFTTDFFLVGKNKEEQGEPVDLTATLEVLKQSSRASSPAISTWITCIKRYLNTNNVQHAADSIKDSIELLEEELESANTTIQYITWAIPSLGFVGTVRGISSALAQANLALEEGNMQPMIESLGLAFNSTLIALLISLVLMLLFSTMNNRQDNMVIKTRKSCEEYLLDKLHD